MPKTLTLLLCALSLALLIGGRTGAAESDPPWIEPDLDNLTVPETVRGKIGLLNWMLARQSDEDLRLRPFGFATTLITYELGYLSNITNEDNWDILRDFAERGSIRLLEFKELLLLEHHRLWGDAPLDPALYEHALNKTALYMLTSQVPLMYLPSVSALSEEVDVAALRAEFLGPPSIRTSIHDVVPDADLADDNLTALALDAIDRVPAMQRYLSETPVCELVADGRSYLEGTSPVGRDVEVGEMLIRHVLRNHMRHLGGADAAYLMGKYFGEFNIFYYGKGKTGERDIRFAANSSHPEASFDMGEIELARGNIEVAFELFLVAQAGGVVGAKAMVEGIQSQIDASKVEEMKDLAVWMLEYNDDLICS